MNKSIKKTLALAVMLAALVAIIIGIGFSSNYKREVRAYTLFTQETIVVKPMGYGYIRIDINESGDHEIRTTLNGTLRMDRLQEDDYLAWVSGTIKPFFRTEVTPSDTGDYYSPYLCANTVPWYNAYWNTNSSASVEVKTVVYSVSTETAYNYFEIGLGIVLIVTGAISGLAAAFSISKRVLLLVVALALVFTGAVAFMIHTQKGTFNETVSSTTILVPANGNVTESIHYNTTGAYALLCKVDKGAMNATTIAEEDYSDYLQGQHEAYWQTWRFEHSLGGMNYLCDLMNGGYKYGSEAYLLLVNSDTYDKVVTVQFERYWEDYNYLGLVGGALAIAGGASLLWYANRQQLTVLIKR